MARKTIRRRELIRHPDGSREAKTHITTKLELHTYRVMEGNSAGMVEMLEQLEDSGEEIFSVVIDPLVTAAQQSRHWLIITRTERKKR